MRHEQAELVPATEAHYRRLERCRICGGTALERYLDLGHTPLANALRRPGEPGSEEVYPLEMLRCHDCQLSQLSIVVDPRHLYAEYQYRSSVSQTFQQHCRELAADCRARLGDGALLAVDIASNDGCLLRAFREQSCAVQGVEPAAMLAGLAEDSGVPTLPRFWGVDVAEEILAERGPAQVVSATNVVGHVDDLPGFARAVRSLLAPEGLFAIEVPYLDDLLAKTEFDTIYHEHLSYFLLAPLVRLLDDAGLQVVDVAERPIHGGSIRVFAARDDSQTHTPRASVAALLAREQERGLYQAARYRAFAERTRRITEELPALLERLVAEGHRIIGYGASAKGNTLLNCSAIDPAWIACIVDDTPGKQGMLSPGRRIPIRSREALSESDADHMLILAWNFAEEIIAKNAAFREAGGRFILPIPQVRVL